MGNTDGSTDDDVLNSSPEDAADSEIATSDEENAYPWLQDGVTKTNIAQSCAGKKSSHLFFSLLGHVIAAAIGLAIGYYILHWLRPIKFPLPW